MDKESVQRMLVLGQRKREGMLEEDELQELNDLRREYLRGIRAGLQQQLDNVYIEQEDGSYKKLEPKERPADAEGDPT